jgi:hypothetical protein
MAEHLQHVSYEDPERCRAALRPLGTLFKNGKARYFMISELRILLCLAVMVIPLKVSAEEVADEDAVLAFLSEVSKANGLALSYANIKASIHYSEYDEKGQKTGEAAHEVQALYKDENLRLDWKEQSDSREWYSRNVVTQEARKEYHIHDTTAVIRESRGAMTMRPFSDFLPSEHVAFLDLILKSVISGEEVVSRKITRQDIDGSEVYVLEVLWEKRPKDICRYYFDPAKGATVVKYEALHDFGGGHILVQQIDGEMQPTKTGGWYLKRSRDVYYRRDGTLSSKKDITIEDFDFASEVSDEVFTWEGMGLPRGTTILDRRFGDLTYKYGVPSVSEEMIYDILEQPLVKETVPKPTAVATQSERQPAVSQDEETKPADGAVIAQGTDSAEGGSGRTIYLFGGTVFVLLVIIAFLLISRPKPQEKRD